MASGPRFLSRRALIKLAAATPASAVALGGVATQAIAEVAASVTSRPADLDKLVKIATHLFKRFLEGVHRWEREHNKKIAVDPEVFERGMTLSGDVVASNLGCFPAPEEFDNAPDAVHPTRRCAVACGWWAAHLASSGGIITGSIFTQAWCDTRETLKAKVCQQPIPSKECGSGHDVSNDLPDDLRKGPLLAYGCA
jgi:hypothetical protein